MGILSEEGIKDLEDRLGIQFSIEDQNSLRSELEWSLCQKSTLY